MPRSTLFSALVVLVTFVCGVAVGAYFFSPPGALDFRRISAGKDGSSASAAGFSDRDPDGAELRAHVAEVEKKLTEMGEKQDAAILSDHLALYKKYKLAPQSFTEGLQVTDEMAEFLKMSKEERSAVEGHLKQIHDQVREFEKRNLKMVKQTDDTVSYEIAPFPEGKGLKDQLNELVTGDLGAERGDVFINSSSWEMNSTFSSFGENKTDLDVTRIDQKGAPQYQVTLSFKNGSMSQQGDGRAMPGPFNGLVELDTNP